MIMTAALGVVALLTAAHGPSAAPSNEPRPQVRGTKVIAAGIPAAPKGVVARATMDDVRAAFDRVPDDRRQKLAAAMKAHPDGFRRAFDAALARGWKPAGEVGYSATARTRPKAGVHLVRQDAGVGSDEGEMLWWMWDDGNPTTWEATLWIHRYDTDESVAVDLQYQDIEGAADADVAFAYLSEYDAGITYDESGGTRDSDLPGLAGYLLWKFACIRDTLWENAKAAVYNTRWQAFWFSVGCLPANKWYILCWSGFVGYPVVHEFGKLMENTRCGLPGSPAPACGSQQ